MIRKRLVLTLADLIEEAEELTRLLCDLQECHLPDPEIITDDNRPIRFPLELNWRPYEDEPMPSQVAAEVIGWIHKHLDVHIENLTRYFVDWKEQRDRLDRFPLIRHPNLPLEGLFACLEEHRDQLRIEEMKEHAVSSEKPAQPQELLADKANVERSTLKRSDTGRMKPGPNTLARSTGTHANQVEEASRQAEPLWVTAAVYAKAHGLSKQTLANWRHLDKKAGRDHAAPGYPEYRRFGTAIRYLLTTGPPDNAAKE